MDGPSRPGARPAQRATMLDVHEFSIAEALAAQVQRHAPASGRVAEVEISVGALRGLEPEALRMSWEAVTHDTPIAGAILRVDLRPWSITCSTWGGTWRRTRSAMRSARSTWTRWTCSSSRTWET